MLITTGLQIASVLLQTYMIILMVAGVLKMAGAWANQPIVRLVYKLTDPPANLIRRLFPALEVRTAGGQWIDLSYFALFLICILLTATLGFLPALLLRFL